MKKLSILVVVLLLVGGFAFAQEVEFKGDATLTAGFDLDTEQFGFKNAASSSLKVTWAFDDASAGGTQAFIELTKMSLVAEDDTVNIDDPTVKAGLTFEPITVTIYSAPSLAFNNATGFKFIPDDPDDPRNDIDPELAANNIATAAGDSTTELLWVATADVDPETDNVIDDTTFPGYSFVERTVAGDDEVKTTFQGFTITAAVDPLSVDLFVATDGTWVENTDNAFAFGSVVTATVDPLTVKAGVIYGPTDDLAELGATASVAAAVGPADVSIGFDYFEEDFDLSAKLGVDLGVASIASLTYLTTSEAETLEMYQELVVDASAAVEELTFKNTTQLETILEDGLKWYNGTDLAYNIDGIKPFTLVEVYDVADELDMDLEVGVEASGMIELTTFTLKYEVDNLLTADNLGLITFATKIAF
jgi:hypothetical protein